MKKISVLILWIYIVSSIAAPNNDSTSIETQNTIKSDSITYQINIIEDEDNKDSANLINQNNKNTNENKIKIEPKHVWMGIGILCAVAGLITIVTLIISNWPGGPMMVGG
jgi:hypothetical protein